MARPLRELRGIVQMPVPAPIVPTFPGLGTQLVIKVVETVETILSKIEGEIEEKKALLTLDQISILTQLKYPNGQVILTLEDRPGRHGNGRALLYEVISIIVQLGFDQTIAFLIRADVVSADEIIFENPTMKQAQDKAKIDAEIYRNKITVSKGMFKCPVCGSHNTVSAEKQVRSADEPASIFVSCLSGGHRWRIG